MNQVNPEGKPQTHVTVPYIHPQVYHQQTTNNQCFGYMRSPVKYQPDGTQNQQSVTLSSTQTQQTVSSGLQYYGETMNCTQHFYAPQHPVGYPPHGRPVRYMPRGAHNQPSTDQPGNNSTQTPEAHEYSQDTPAVTQDIKAALPGAACQPQKPAPSLPQGMTGTGAHCSRNKPEGAVQKRELRLMKNREAARECRRKKKEYVKCLENRVAVLENQNKTLIEELRALKDIYRHKAEEAARECRKRKKEYMSDLVARNTTLENENLMLKAEVMRLINQNI